VGKNLQKNARKTRKIVCPAHPIAAQSHPKKLPKITEKGQGSNKTVTRLSIMNCGERWPMIRENDYVRLAAQARSGDQESMSLLAVKICDRLYPYLHRTVLDSELAEDLLQEVLLTTLRFVGRIKEPERFWPWIYRVARSKIQEHLRNERRAQEFRLSPPSCSYHLEQPENADDVLKRIEDSEKMDNLFAALQRLKKPYRIVVQLRCLAEMPYTEIASIMKWTPQKARIRFFRARQLLKRSPLVTCFADD
jgi:RNA polymerase sigma factor (sigma-70 family)